MLLIPFSSAFKNFFYFLFSGVLCPVVGRISMDAITVNIPDEAKECREFLLITPDFNETTSAVGISRIQKTIPYEVCTNISNRVPRLYETDGKTLTMIEV